MCQALSNVSPLDPHHNRTVYFFMLYLLRQRTIDDSWLNFEELINKRNLSYLDPSNATIEEAAKAFFEVVPFRSIVSQQFAIALRKHRIPTSTSLRSASTKRRSSESQYSTPPSASTTSLCRSSASRRTARTP
jgi:hypothetical protein